jgi:hypothetical protein
VKPRIGYRMRELADVVSACPGISRRGALRAADLPERGLGYGRPLDRAIRAGLIIQDQANPWVRRSHYALFASERDRDLFNLRAELMSRPTPARAAEIAAEVARLRQAQAAAFADACG